jgi:hypothetical protein
MKRLVAVWIGVLVDGLACAVKVLEVVEAMPRERVAQPAQIAQRCDSKQTECKDQNDLSRRHSGGRFDARPRIYSQRASR